MRKKIFTLLTLLAMAVMGAQAQSTSVTLANGADLFFSVYTWGGVTSVSLDSVHNVDGKVIDIPGTVVIGGNVYEMTAVGAYSFYQTDVMEVIIPDECTDIWFGAFEECHQLTTVTVGLGMADINETAFTGCTALTTFNLNARNVTDMASFDGSGCFDGCTALATINIGDSVRAFHNSLFDELSGLRNINIRAERLIPITNNHFWHSARNLNITVPCSQVANYQADAVWSALGTITGMCSSAVLTVVSNDTSKGTAYGSGNYDRGDTALVYATPRGGYKFVGWSDSSNFNPRQVVVSSDSTISAFFALPDTAATRIVVIDSIVYHDSIVYRDSTIYEYAHYYDTVLIQLYDTIQFEVNDTIQIVVYDTIRIPSDSSSITGLRINIDGLALTVVGLAPSSTISLLSESDAIYATAEADIDGVARVVLPFPAEPIKQTPSSTPTLRLLIGNRTAAIGLRQVGR
ncbi:MAG: leucine-rich repeat domain-containing protein [Bacteroidales bacterium]|nr:leucine-rich repeat domain-containing protein [Bacteroidales bacterium]